MKSAIIFYMLLGIIVNFPNDVTPQSIGKVCEQGHSAVCECADGTACGGASSCSCTTGTCTFDSGVPFEVPDEGVRSGLGWEHCYGNDGSKCVGTRNCYFEGPPQSPDSLNGKFTTQVIRVTHFDGPMVPLDLQPLKSQGYPYNIHVG